jgi:hypothetical protein
MRIGNRTVYDITAICVHGLSADIILGSDVLSEFADYSIDEANKKIIFE